MRPLCSLPDHPLPVPNRPPGTAIGTGAYTRNWRVASSSLTRALGRPLRDQVYSTRDTQATTLQALELVNGEALTHWLSRGARKMLGELPPEPIAAFDQRVSRGSDRGAFDIDVSGTNQIWFLVQDMGSYSPERVEAAWARAELVGPNGATPVSSLKPRESSGLRAATDRSAGGLPVKTPSTVMYDISGMGYTRLRGEVRLENRTITSDISPQIRFFIFLQQPNMERLTPVAPETPLPAGPALKTAAEVVDRVFWYALGRAPSDAERRVSQEALTDPGHPDRLSADGLADLLWAVMMKPEFQLVY